MNKTKTISIALAFSMLAACTSVTTESGTSYTFDAPQALRIVASIDSGFAQLLSDPDIAKNLGADRVKAIKDNLDTISTIQAKLAASSGSVSIDVQKSWVKTAESAADSALLIASDLNKTGLIPAPASTIITALTVLAPALETIIGAVASPYNPSGLTVDDAQTIIANKGNI